MNVKSLIVGILAGALMGFVLAKYLASPKTTPPTEDNIREIRDTATASAAWPDSLDAVTRAPQSHDIVYEDSAVRILRVLLKGNSTEPVHTHKWKSVMWFANAVPMTYYQYTLKGNAYQLTDSIPIAKMPAGALNKAGAVEAEGPHAIRNTSADTGIAYRVEFKKDN